MCGLPTETDEDVLGIADMAKKVIKAGREVTGSRDIRCTVSIGGFVPKPHTPFQWAAQADHETVDRRLQGAARRDPRRQEVRPGDRLPLPRRQARRSSRACSPAATAGSARSSARSGRTAAASTAGASTSPTSAGWLRRRARRGRRRRRLVHDPRARGERSCPGTTWTRASTSEWLWQDWQDAVDEVEVEDCRWTPCFDCGVCPTMGTEIQIGPTGKKLLPLTVV